MDYQRSVAIFQCGFDCRIKTVEQGVSNPVDSVLIDFLPVQEVNIPKKADCITVN